MTINYAALKTELETDPNAYGYAQHIASGQDWALADMVNVPRGAIQIDRDIVPAYEIYEQIVPSEWATITAQEKQRVQIILGMGDVYIRGVNTRASFQAAFGPGTQTRANLIALLTRNGSRAEQLFGANTRITSEDVAKARVA